MRKVIPWLLSILVLSAFCSASAVDVERAQADALEVDKLEDAAREYTGGLDIDTGTSLEDGLQKIVDTGSNQASGIFRKAVRSGILLLAVVLLCGMADSVNSDLGSGEMDVVTVAGALAVTAVAVADIHSLIGMGRETIQNMGFFSKVLLPAITAAAAAGGSPGNAVARQLATVLFSDTLLTVIDKLLLPLVYVYIAACTAYTALGNEGLKRIASSLKWVVTTALTAIVLIFVAYLTVSGVIAGAADVVTVKAAKLAVSSAVPVVGGILSDAAETVLAGAGILKNAIGVFGMLVVLAICVVPFLQLGIHYLIYKAASILTATVSQSRVSALIDSIGGAFGLILGMTGSCAMLLLVSMVSAISVAAG